MEEGKGLFNDSIHLDERSRILPQQGRIYGNPNADVWAGAVMRKPLGIQKCDGRTDRHTDRHSEV